MKKMSQLMKDLMNTDFVLRVMIKIQKLWVSFLGTDPRKQRWVSAEIAYIKKHSNQGQITDMAKKLNRSPIAIKNKLFMLR